MSERKPWWQISHEMAVESAMRDEAQDRLDAERYALMAAMPFHDRVVGDVMRGSPGRSPDFTAPENLGA